MKLSATVCSFCIVVSIATISCRVPVPPNSFTGFRRQKIIQHPPPLTRSTDPTTALDQQGNAGSQNNQGNQRQNRNNAKPVTTTKKTTTTTTTPEPPEPTEAPEYDDEVVQPRYMPRVYPQYNNYDYYYNYAPRRFGYNHFGNIFNNYEDGEYEDRVEVTTRPPRLLRKQTPIPPPPPPSRVTTTTTTTTAATTTAEAPEPDDDIISSPAPTRASISGSGSGEVFSASGQGEGYSGYCFCSPLSSCPMDSVPRGGLCHSFLTYFTSLRFIRCCYSPSVAKTLQL